MLHFIRLYLPVHIYTRVLSVRAVFSKQGVKCKCPYDYVCSCRRHSYEFSNMPKKLRQKPKICYRSTTVYWLCSKNLTTSITSIMLLFRPLVGIRMNSLTVKGAYNSLVLPNPAYRKFSVTSYYLNKNLIDSRNHEKEVVSQHARQEIPAEIFEKKQVISRRIPGETPQENDLKSRFPASLHFEKEAVPTLLPRPGVPAPNKYPLARLYDALTKKTEPELIYEAEPHKLYFVFCYAFALLFMIYGLNAFHIGSGLAWDMYENNDLKLAETQKKIQLVMHLGIVTVLSAMPFLAGIAFLFVPSRLVRRIWYLPPVSSTGKMRPDGQAFVKVTTHPLLPNRPTPVYTFPLGELQKSITAKIYSGKGFYGTNDSSFFFFLKEKGKRIPFVVDRKGFFWGDGRVFDLLFSDDPIEKVENAKKIDDIYGDMIRERKHKEHELKKELGFGWRTKASAKLMKEDIQKLRQLVSNKNVPTVKNEEKEDTQINKKS